MVDPLPPADREAAQKPPRFIRRFKRGFELLAKNAAACVDGTPFKMPIAVLNACLDLANACLLQTVSDNTEALKALSLQTARRLRTVNKALILAPSQDVSKRISDFSKILIQEVEGLDSLLKRGVVDKVLLSTEDIQNITNTIRRVDGYLAEFQAYRRYYVNRKEHGGRSRAVSCVYSLLPSFVWPRSQHATYGADTEPGITLLKREPCTKNTRVAIRHQIERWVEDPSPDSPGVFWLTGHAGSGKSTIAFSISQRYGPGRRSNLLAANFFCSRQFADTRARKYIVPSIVYQLARHSSSFRRALVAVNRFGAPDEPDEQFKALLTEPWKECLRQRPFEVPPLLIVIDALDEIADGKGSIFLKELLGAIRDGHMSGLKFLVTSRPDPEIVSLCNSFPQGAVCQLHQVDTDGVLADIQTFLNRKLRALRGQPELEDVARRSGGLFIYAATAVRRNLLLVDTLYKQVLWAAFCDLEEEQFRPRLHILHAILSIPSALSPSRISQLDPAFAESLVRIVVGDLHAVLYIKDGKIYSYHTSFSDFIFDSKRSKFSFDAAGQSWTADLSCSRDARLGFMQRLVAIEIAERDQLAAATAATFFKGNTPLVMMNPQEGVSNDWFNPTGRGPFSAPQGFNRPGWGPITTAHKLGPATAPADPFYAPFIPPTAQTPVRAPADPLSAVKYFPAFPQLGRRSARLPSFSAGTTPLFQFPGTR
ncbi:hypothetical protein B0H16DRAFT_1730430 [Mycena metata]|uniref:NACHT domain-containing protein n=1 Tax=Mycena metata TaxID=1033252 RepID=A0AAD7MYA8_9AGAR|nr:hypothetical protein B0H16DRAFT_1730430 [Mycena metata]